MGFFKLLPQEDKFNVLFEVLADQCVRSIDLLELVLTKPDAPETHQGISELKKASKEKYEELSNQLCRSFITPFDREDLLLLGSTLYKSIKLTEKIKTILVLNKLKTYNSDFQQLLDILKRDVTSIKPLIVSLNKQRLKDVQKETAVLHKLEDDADDLLAQLVSKLCSGQLPYQEVILRKDVYLMFERLTDLYRDCANIALQIILKHT